MGRPPYWWISRTSLPCRVCWLSLDVLDQDPQQLCTYLIAAIEQRFPGFGRQSEAVLKSMVSFGQETERLLVILCNEIQERVDQHFALIVDDYQFVDTIPDIRYLLSRFISWQAEKLSCHPFLAPVAEPARYRSHGGATTGGRMTCRNWPSSR